ncbi:MAG TPA: DUF4255 domain-containing protein [Pyrinomonadaceae bacterium]|jgi:hypothetical protein|nr:DUF4255 domain-containing protein [Pyrinomonadaceae bacterium]
MSNSLAIAAVTATLRQLLDKGINSIINGVFVTTQPPDVADSKTNLVNIFLYQTMINPAWRNQDMPRQTKPNETGLPPLPLNLYYLITAYSNSDDSPEPFSHRILGQAMSILHDNPVLSSEEIKAALPPNDLKLYDLYDQIEHVRITPQPLTLDEMSKLWTMFQTKYRISTAYQVSVVLIESNRASRSPLPVLKRGPEDRGAEAQGNMLSPLPTLTGIELATKTQPSAQLGEKITLSGYQLDGDSLLVRFENPRLTTPNDIGPLAAIKTADQTDVLVTLPNDANAQTDWVAGFYSVSIEVTNNADAVNPQRATNALSFSLAPRILTINPTARLAANGDFELTLTCSPQVRLGQRATLLFGANEIKATPPPGQPPPQTDTLKFHITPITAASIGEYYLRLRVDGVDSLLVKYQDIAPNAPPAFDDNQKVTIA